MSYGQPTMSIGPRITPMVKKLIFICIGVFLLSLLAGREIWLIFGLRPVAVWSQFYLWQLVTYIFLHGGIFHILINMLILWMFGSELERYLGSKRFLHFFFVTGIGAGIISVIADPFSNIPTIGASGSVYGVLMAYGMLFPERVVHLLLFFVFPVPIKVKYLVTILGGIAFISALSSPGSNIAHIAHLGGMLVAFLYLKGWLFPSKIREAFFRWRLKRMRRKFKVYSNEEQDRRRDDYWIN